MHPKASSLEMNSNLQPTFFARCSRPRRRWLSAFASQSTSVIQRFRQDWSVVTANSRLIPLTVLRSAMNRTVRYSAKCRRSGSLANRSRYCASKSYDGWEFDNRRHMASGSTSIAVGHDWYRTTGGRSDQIVKL